MRLRGSVNAWTADPEYDDAAHLNVRDSSSGYWFSLFRLPDEVAIEVMVLDQLNYRDEMIQVMLEPQAFRATLSEAAASGLDGNRHYVIEFPVAQYAAIRNALEAMFRGLPGLKIVD